MDKKTYRQQFSRAIRHAPSAIKRNIMNDVDAILADIQDENADLIDRLGSPKQLAEKYLKDVNIPITPIRRVLYWLRNSLIMLAIIMLGIIAALYAVYSYYSDYMAFDYSNQELAYQHEDFTNEYRIAMPENTTVNMDIKPMEITVNQSDSVIYLHEKNEIFIRCKAELDPSLPLRISQNACLVFLPKVTLNMLVKQSQITLIKPIGKLAIDARQASIRLLEDTAGYQFEIESRQSKPVTLQSTPNAENIIQLKLYQSQFTPFVY